MRRDDEGNVLLSPRKFNTMVASGVGALLLATLSWVGSDWWALRITGTAAAKGTGLPAGCCEAADAKIERHIQQSDPVVAHYQQQTVPALAVLRTEMTSMARTVDETRAMAGRMQDQLSTQASTLARIEGLLAENRRRNGGGSRTGGGGM